MSGGKILPLSFFRRPAATVARELIGMQLLRSIGNEEARSAVLETEVYEGVHDLASHSSKGRTARTEVMFGTGGCFYIYRIYGLHWMLNVVTGEVDAGEAVLIRGVAGIIGPGRVAAALAIGPELNRLPASRKSGLWLEYPFAPRRYRIVRTARIGVDYAGPLWSAKKLRFVASEAKRSRE